MTPISPSPRRLAPPRRTRAEASITRSDQADGKRFVAGLSP